MKSSLKLKLLFRNRLGIIADIAPLMAARGINVVSMEVEEVKGDKTFIYFEIERDEPIGPEELFEDLRRVAGSLEVTTIQTLPQERREKRLQVVLDSVSDGILAVDEEGVVTTINRLAREILGREPGEVVGRRLEELGPAGTGLRQCLEGREYQHQKRNVLGKQGRYQFFATGRPILDSRGRIVGAVEIMKEMREVRELVNAVSGSEQIGFSDLIGQSPAIQTAIDFAQKIAATDAVVSIRGESGTGKELFASALHTESGRSGPFVPLNCAALPEALLESELFGYVGGAFSGASREGKAGLFETAQGGTLFLDEIGEMPLSLQAKMLRVIQERRVRRVGGAGEIPVDVRIVTATNKNLERLVEEHSFREDLYYRINVFPIHIPPLRERPEDVPLLAENFLFQFNTRLGRPLQSFAPAALDRLQRHGWPGNVRELRNVIERAAILCSEQRVAADCILFGAEVGRAVNRFTAPPSDKGEQTLPALLERYERQLLREALQGAPSVRRLARRLGVSHTTLLNKLKKHGLQLEKN